MALVLKSEDIVALLDLDACISSVEAAYRDLGRGVALNRPRSHVHARTKRPGEILRFKTMEGMWQEGGVHALRVVSDIVSWPKGEGAGRQVKIPAAPGGRFAGWVLLFDIETGALLALLHDSMISRIRMGASCAVAARYLARKDARTLGIIGSGALAKMQARALAKVLPIGEINIFSPSADHREEAARLLAKELSIPVLPKDHPDKAAEGADVLLSSTNSLSPVIDAPYLAPGRHVSVVRTGELTKAARVRLDLTVMNTRDGEGTELATDDLKGEIPYFQNKGAGPAPSYPELCEVAAGVAPARQSDQEISCYLNNAGLGIQFAAVAKVVFESARQKGVGTLLADDLLYQEMWS